MSTCFARQASSENEGAGEWRTGATNAGRPRLEVHSQQTALLNISRQPAIVSDAILRDRAAQPNCPSRSSVLTNRASGRGCESDFSQRAWVQVCSKEAFVFNICFAMTRRHPGKGGRVLQVREHGSGHGSPVQGGWRELGQTQHPGNCCPTSSWFASCVPAGKLPCLPALPGLLVGPCTAAARKSSERSAQVSFRHPEVEAPLGTGDKRDLCETLPDSEA